MDELGEGIVLAERAKAARRRDAKEAVKFVQRLSADDRAGGNPITCGEQRRRSRRQLERRFLDDRRVGRILEDRALEGLAIGDVARQAVEFGLDRAVVTNDANERIRGVGNGFFDQRELVREVHDQELACELLHASHSRYLAVYLGQTGRKSFDFVRRTIRIAAAVRIAIGLC